MNLLELYVQYIRHCKNESTPEKPLTNNPQ